MLYSGLLDLYDLGLCFAHRQVSQSDRETAGRISSDTSNCSVSDRTMLSFLRNKKKNVYVMLKRHSIIVH
jgi:hypothetical protein